MENNPGIPPTPYRFSNDELRALQECNSESFFYRSLPLGAIMGFGTHVAVKNGYFSATRYGSAPKVALAIVAGYILGKISYQGKCAEKIMAIPDSKFGAILRERKRAGKYTESITLDQPDLGKLFGDSPPKDVYSDVRVNESAPSYMDIDTERRQEDIDNYNWNRLEDSRTDDSLLPSPNPRTITSYEELRKKNRDDYEANKNRYQRPIVRQDDTLAPQNDTRPSQTPPQTYPEYQRPKTTNQYGDSWEK